jgi:hypothetical protein
VRPVDQAVDGGRGPLPGSLLASGVLLIVGAVLAALLGAMVVLSAAVMESLPNRSGMSPGEFRALMATTRPAMIGIGVVILAAGAFHLLGGIGVLKRRTWGRILGLVVSLIGIVLFGFALISLLVALSGPIDVTRVDPSRVNMTPEQFQAMMGISLGIGIALVAIGLAIYLFIAATLIRRGSSFG